MPPFPSGGERPTSPGGWRRDDRPRRPASGGGHAGGGTGHPGERTGGWRPDERGDARTASRRPVPRDPVPAERVPLAPAPGPAREASAPEVRETAICGWNSVAAVFSRRPAAVRRLFFEERLAPRTGPWCSALAADRRVYRQVPAADLEKLSDTLHHGGIVAIVEETRIELALDSDAARWAAQGRGILVVDGVGNPHNLGFLARTAAFFGFSVVLVASRGVEAAPRHIAPSAHRVAEGAFEWLEVRHVPQLADFIRRNRASFLWCATDVRSDAEPLEGFDVRRLHRPPAVVFGNEENGVSPSVLQACEKRFVVKGTGAIESLNVAASAAIVLHHLATAVKRLGGSAG